VEQNFNFTENILKKIIKSRSNCLKYQKFDEINYWNEKLIEIEPQITESCTKIIERFNQEIENKTYIEIFSEKNAWIKNISLSFNPGFNKNTSFKDVLMENISKDKVLCRTTSGPHKRFFKINVNDIDASLILSRGQQKIASIILHLVQREIIKNDTGISPILLMDDISSELDKDNANLMLKYLINNSIQTIMTSIENNHFSSTDVVCMFHVEQKGDLSNVR
jgi:DNA replication and repair protein RecF